MKNIKRHVSIKIILNTYILASTVTGCVFNFCICFISLCSCWITIFAVGIEIYAIIAGIKKYKSIIKKKKMKHYEKVFLGRDKINTIKVLISKFLTIYILAMTNLFEWIMF